MLEVNLDDEVDILHVDSDRKSNVYEGIRMRKTAYILNSPAYLRNECGRIDSMEQLGNNWPKKNPKRLLSIHPHHHRYYLTAHLVSLMFSTRDYTSDTGFL